MTGPFWRVRFEFECVIPPNNIIPPNVRFSNNAPGIFIIHQYQRIAENFLLIFFSKSPLGQCIATAFNFKEPEGRKEFSDFKHKALDGACFVVWYFISAVSSLPRSLLINSLIRVFTHTCMNSTIFVSVTEGPCGASSPLKHRQRLPVSLPEHCRH